MRPRAHDPWTGRLSDFLDGTLEGAARAEVEEHLADCADCRSVLEELRDLVARAGGLGETRPGRDLWPGIAAAIDTPIPDQPTGTDSVIRLPTARQPAGRSEGVFLTRPQLVAASVALAVVSAAVTWWAGPGIAVRDGGGPAPAGVSVVTMAADEAGPPADLVAELEALEAALTAAQGSLDPETVRILQTNLSVIERAIEDSRRALAVDPGNAYLRDHLEGVYRDKADYLREATGLVEWIG